MQVKVGSPLVELSPDKQSMYITINIEEGPQYRLGKVDVTGDLLMPREYFLSRVSVKTGEIFNRSKLSDDLQKLTDYYKDRGYAYVNASPSTPVNEKTRVVDVFFEIRKGELVTVNRINIRGNNKTRDKVIRRELRLAEGDLSTTSRCSTTRRSGSTRSATSRRSRCRPSGASRRQDGRQLRGRRASDRDVPDRRRVLLGGELHRPGPDLAEQPVRPRAAARPCRRSSPASASSSCCSSRTSTSSTPTGPSASTCSTRTVPLLVHPLSTGGSLTWGYLLAEDLRLLLTYKLEQVGIGTSSFGFGGGSSGHPPSASPSPPAASPTCSARGSPRRSGRRCPTTRATIACSPAAAGTTPSPPRSPIPT